MSELQGYLSDAQSQAADLASILSDLETTLGRAQDEADSLSQEGISDRLSDIVAVLEDASSALARVDDYMPSRYTEVGDVSDLLDSVHDYLSSASDALDQALTQAQDLSNEL